MTAEKAEVLVIARSKATKQSPTNNEIASPAARNDR